MLDIKFVLMTIKNGVETYKMKVLLRCYQFNNVENF